MSAHARSKSERLHSLSAQVGWQIMFLWEYIFSHKTIHCIHKYLMSAQDWQIEKNTVPPFRVLFPRDSKHHSSLWRGRFKSVGAYSSRVDIVRSGFDQDELSAKTSQFRTLLRFSTAVRYLRHCDAAFSSPSWHGSECFKDIWRLAMVMVTRFETNRTSLQVHSRLRVAKLWKREPLQGQKF